MEESLYPWKRIWRTLYRGNQNNEERVEFSPRPNPSRKILRQLIQHSSTVTGNGNAPRHVHYHASCKKTETTFFVSPPKNFHFFCKPHDYFPEWKITRTLCRRSPATRSESSRKPLQVSGQHEVSHFQPRHSIHADQRWVLSSQW